MTVFRSTGVLRYSPTLNGSLARRDGGTTRWWLILDCDPDLGRYFRHLFHLAAHRTQALNCPLWDAHISVIANEPPPPAKVDLWGKYEGRELEFAVSLAAETDGTYVWMPVTCEPALDMREELGLPRQPFLPLHLTIGNAKTE